VSLCGARPWRAASRLISTPLHNRSAKFHGVNSTAYNRARFPPRIPRAMIRSEVHAGQHASHYGGTGVTEPVNGLRRPTIGMASTESTRGSRFPSFTIQRVKHRIGGVDVPPSSVPNAPRRCGSIHWRPVTHGDKSDRPGRRDALPFSAPACL
jgi:hypothetical protein